MYTLYTHACMHAPIKHAPSTQLKFHDIIDDSNKNRYKEMGKHTPPKKKGGWRGEWDSKKGN